MSSHAQQVSLSNFAAAERSAVKVTRERYKAVYEGNRHRIYSIAFWMSDNEITAEEISMRVFSRAFRNSANPSPELLDVLLVSELREFWPIGVLTLLSQETGQTSVRGIMKRAHMECAVVRVPPTERLAFLLHDVEGYGHRRVAKTLGITETESALAVHQARLLIRQLVSEMVFCEAG